MLSSVQPTGETDVEEAGLSVIVPAFNEEGGVGPVVEALLEELGKSGQPFEVILVNDGSTDGTAEEAERAGARVLRHATNRGYGASLKTGIRHARFPLVCMTDADGTYPAKSIPALVGQLAANQSDMVVGSRTGASVAIPLVRRPAKWILGRLAELVAGEPIPDLNSGLRVFRRRHVLRFFNLVPDGFSFTTTLTLAMLSNGYLVDYVPIDYSARVGRSKIRPIRDTLGFFGLVLRIALYFAPLKVFLPLSGVLLLLAVGWALLSKFAIGTLADVSTVVIVVAAVQVAIVGLVAELINRRVTNTYREEN